jgi:PAS domain S-box-containing protein
MSAAGKPFLTSVKGSLFRDPAAVGATGAVLAVLAIMNGAALLRGADWPWLLGATVLADVIAVGAGALIAAREVMVADRRSDATEARLASIVDSAMDAIITVDATQTVVQFNRAAEQLFGCATGEALGAPLDRFIPQRFRAAHRAHVEQFGRTGSTSRRMGDMTTLWALRADGSEFPIEASISQSGEGERRYFTVILRDITRRKEFEDAMQHSREELRELSARVVDAREDEKTRIARELHDELGQMLTALKFDLAFLRERLPPAESEVAARAGQMSELLDRTVSATRRISADLRPLMLDDLGLADAASWLVQEFSERSGIACDIELAGAEVLQDITGSLATAVYRALQESLTNIARHSGARRVRVRLSAQDDEVRLEVEDDGRGFAQSDLAKLRSLGLKGMRERFAYLGGALEIENAPQGGTRLRIRAPLRRTQAGGAT